MWIDKIQKQIELDIQKIDRDKENGIEKDKREFQLTKRQKEIEVNRPEIETNMGGYTMNRQRYINGIERDRREFVLTKDRKRDRGEYRQWLKRDTGEQMRDKFSISLSV